MTKNLTIEDLLAALANMTGETVTVSVPSGPQKVAPPAAPKVEAPKVRKVKADALPVTGYGKKSGGVDGMKPLTLDDGTTVWRRQYSAKVDIDGAPARVLVFCNAESLAPGSTVTLTIK